METFHLFGTAPPLKIDTWNRIVFHLQTASAQDVMMMMYAVSSLPHYTYGSFQGKSGSDRIHLLTCLRHRVPIDDEFELILATLQATPPIIATTCPVFEAQVPTPVILSCVRRERAIGSTDLGSGEYHWKHCEVCLPQGIFWLWRSDPFYEYQPTVTPTTSARWECINYVPTDCIGRSDFRSTQGPTVLVFRMLPDTQCCWTTNKYCIRVFAYHPVALKMMIYNPFSFDTDTPLLATTSDVDVTIFTKFDLYYYNSSTIVKIMLVITFGGAAAFIATAPRAEKSTVWIYRYFVMTPIHAPRLCQSFVIIKEMIRCFPLWGRFDQHGCTIWRNRYRLFSFDSNTINTKINESLLSFYCKL